MSWSFGMHDMYDNIGTKSGAAFISSAAIADLGARLWAAHGRAEPEVAVVMFQFSSPCLMAFCLSSAMVHMAQSNRALQTAIALDSGLAVGLMLASSPYLLYPQLTLSN